MDRSYLIAFWSPRPIATFHFCMDYFVSSLKKAGDIQCLVCKNSRDRRNLHVLRQADLVVIVLRQNHREICNLFCKNFVRFPNCVYMIVDYFPESEFDLKKISLEFRIPLSRLSCIPYNPGCWPALERGFAPRHWHLGKTPHISPSCMDFYRELDKAFRMILKALDF